MLFSKLQVLPLLPNLVLYFRDQCQSLEDTALWHRVQCQSLEDTALWHRVQCRSLEDTALWHRVQCQSLEDTALWHRVQCRSLEDTALWHRVQCQSLEDTALWHREVTENIFMLLISVKISFQIFCLYLWGLPWGVILGQIPLVFWLLPHWGCGSCPNPLICLSALS